MYTTHSAGIYEGTPSGSFPVPFNITLDPMLKLLLVSINNDPDEEYTAFEPQLFDDDITGSGLLVIAYRRDGKIDVYHQFDMTPWNKNLNMVGKGLANMIGGHISPALFDTGSKGVDLHVGFTDKKGRKISLRVKENSARLSKPFAVLAPFPHDNDNPVCLPIGMMYGMRFVPAEGPEIEVKVAGRTHKPDMLGMPIDFKKSTFIRYSDDLQIVTLNEDLRGPLKLTRPGENCLFADNGIEYKFLKNSGFYELGEFTITKAKHRVRFVFDSTFPDITAMKDKVHLSGYFGIEMEGEMGVIEGLYSVRRTGNKVKMQLVPSAGWQPKVKKLEAKLMFLMASFFKGWPKTYKWNATADISDSAKPVITASSWTRTGKSSGSLKELTGGGKDKAA